MKRERRYVKGHETVKKRESAIKIRYIYIIFKITKSQPYFKECL